jgi:hydrogenase nickel incorporation protein HypA/HybF
MDERNLANYLLELADRTAYKHSAQRIVSIDVAIGGCRILDPARLSDTFGEIAHGTVAEGAILRIKVLPVRRHCQNCGSDFEATAKDVPCPECSHPHTEPSGGEEIRVLEMQIDEHAA